jgi:hypothetical protein
MECAIQTTLGVTELCPGAECPFWEIADGATPEGCFVHRRFPVDLNNREVRRVASRLAPLAGTQQNE